MPVQVLTPTAEAIALVCDSPHSGSDYPPDFNYSVSLADLRKCEDTHLQWLWDSVPRMGGTLIQATFPRSYIDPNRNRDDIDVSMLADEWRGPVASPSRILALGSGLIASHTPARLPIYARRLMAKEVAHRIEHYWAPYRRALAHALEEAGRDGHRWHFNLLSFPSGVDAREAPNDGARPDVLIGDLNGQSCNIEFRDLLVALFSRRGYSVEINAAIDGQDLLREFGAPWQGFESLQVELNQAIYLDEKSRELLPRASDVRDDIAEVMSEVASYIRRSTPRT